MSEQPFRLLVVGKSGQVARSLEEAAATLPEVHLRTFGRPELDLADESTLLRAFAEFNPNLVINAAAYTAVDAAEDNEGPAFAVNAEGTEKLAQVCAEANVPLLHISTDYVFTGDKDGAYVETDPTGPTGVYGRSKLRGEILALEAHSKTAIFRTAWVYSPFGKNFLKTMLMLAEKRDELGIVSDQHGNPTYAPDIADALLAVAAKIRETGWRADYAGIFHLAGSGETTWHEFADAIFETAAEYGHPRPTVKAITTADYPTPAKRPANSRLDCGKLLEIFGVALPDWRESTKTCVKRLFQSHELG